MRKLTGARKAGLAQRDPQVPEGTRVYAVGDIHGRADLLRTLQKHILADADGYPECEKTVIYVGDYVDRGLNSRDVLDLLIDAPLPGFRHVYLKGNHEAMMLDFLDDPAAGGGWLQIGGRATLFSYQVGLDEKLRSADRLADAQRRLWERLPPKHVQFLKTLSLSHVMGDYFFVHAGVRPRRPLDDQAEHDLLWIREGFVDSPVDHGKLVVHGHSITWKPEIRPNRIGIDTGAFATGVLTCLALHGREREFIQVTQQT